MTFAIHFYEMLRVSRSMTFGAGTSSPAKYSEAVSEASIDLAGGKILIPSTGDLKVALTRTESCPLSAGR